MSAAPSQAPVVLQAPSLLQVAGVVHGFTTRHGGVSASPYDSLNLALRLDDPRPNVLANRQRVLQHLGCASASWVSLRQTHSALVVQVTRNAGPNIEADALWTRDPQAAIAILTADCLPILMAHRQGRAVAAVHAGWRGTAAGIGRQTVERLAAVGVLPADLQIALGPAIGPCCFEIGTDVATQLREAVGAEAAEASMTPRGDKVMANLWELNRSQLLAAGVPADNIEVLSKCTRCSPELFSYRRDAGTTGRQAGVIALA